MQKTDFVIIYLSISLVVLQFFYVREAHKASYYQGRCEVLEVMAELTDPGPYVSPTKVNHK